VRVRLKITRQADKVVESSAVGGGYHRSTSIQRRRGSVGRILGECGGKLSCWWLIAARSEAQVSREMRRRRLGAPEVRDFKIMSQATGAVAFAAVSLYPFISFVSPVAPAARPGE
jgi:hypothetical protein